MNEIIEMEPNDGLQQMEDEHRFFIEFQEYVSAIEADSEYQKGEADE